MILKLINQKHFFFCFFNFKVTFNPISQLLKMETMGYIQKFFLF